ncbi:MAG: radical SAM/SPASM domain-containing protein [Desulfuromonadaceae bacterium]
MKLVRLCKNTFTRNYGEFGYVTSQLTKHDRVYNDAGGVFLTGLSRKARTVEEIVHVIFAKFEDVDYQTIKDDFTDFIDDLERHSYVVTGQSEAELDLKEPFFSYAGENPKTATINFMEPDRKPGMADTSAFFYEQFHERPTIFAAQIELTNRCNERCVHCYIPHEKKTTDLDTDIVIDTLNQFAEMGTVGLILSGGEMFMHQDVEKILRHAREKDFSISVLSNVTLIDDQIVSLLKDINVNMVQVSVYSMNPIEHDAITKLPGSHQRTLSAIEKLLNADIPIQISCPVMKGNRQAYKNVLTWAYGKKIRAQTDFIMMAMADGDTSNLAHRISIPETEELLKDIIEVDDNYRQTLDLPPKTLDLEKYARQPVCGVAVDNICVAADGNVYPCSGWQGYQVGDVKKQRISDIWENSEKLKYLRTITNGSFLGCLVCDAKDYCAMCLVRNYNESGGDMFKINQHFCEAAFLNKRLVEEYKDLKGAASD